MPSTTLVATLASLLLLSTGVQAGYKLTDEFDKDNFFNEFDFFSAGDPTHGFVQYTDAKTANDAKLAGFVDTGIYLGADHVTANPGGSGRQSTRVSSKKTWTHGLFIADMAHMPSSTCGVWPAYWLVGANWPNQGEIDIVEGVHTATTNAITLHTSAGCTITADGSADGTKLSNPDCNSGGANNGCSQSVSGTNTFGDGFNAVGGGVYATEWTSDAISIWFFPRSAIPSDVTSGNPNPGSWGAPQAKFNGGQGCNIDDHFKDHSIVFDITFCGDWAGNVWAQNKDCSALAPTCNAYVAGNPGAFDKSYFLVNYIQVYGQS